MNKKITKRVEQLSMIAEAWTKDELPVNEKWYQDRLSHCEPCPYNSENVKEENKTIAQKIREKVPKLKGRYCIACTCPIDKKASVKRATCGLIELQKKPLWLPIEVESLDSTGFSVEHSGEHPYEIIAEEGGSFMLDTGSTTKEMVGFSFKVFAPIQNTFIASIPSCGCTVAESVQLDTNYREFSLRVSTIGFGIGAPTTRSILLRYKDKSLNVKFKILKR